MLLVSLGNALWDYPCEGKHSWSLLSPWECMSLSNKEGRKRQPVQRVVWWRLLLSTCRSQTAFKRRTLRWSTADWTDRVFCNSAGLSSICPHLNKHLLGQNKTQGQPLEWQRAACWKHTWHYTQQGRKWCFDWERFLHACISLPVIMGHKDLRGIALVLCSQRLI